MFRFGSVGQSRYSEKTCAIKSAKRANKGYLLATPPLFADMGKLARGIFSNGYYFDVLKATIGSKTENGVEFGSNGEYNFKSGEAIGHVECRHKLPEIGSTLAVRWNHENIFGLDLTHADKMLKGVTFGIYNTFHPPSAATTSKLKGTYQVDCFALNCELDFKSSSPIIDYGVVVGQDGYFLGYNSGYNTETSQVTKHSLALDITAGDYIWHHGVRSEDGDTCFTAQAFHKVTSELDVAYQAEWLSGKYEIKYGIGGQYKIDEKSIVRAKVDNLVQVGLGYQYAMKEGITLGACVSVDCKNNQEHKWGAFVQFQA